MNTLVIYISFLISALVVCSSEDTSYAPRRVPCPSPELVRPATSMNQREEEFGNGNRPNRMKALKQFLKSSNVEELKDDGFLSLLLPINIAIAISGGGFRAMLSGGGALAALDKRTKEDGGKTEDPSFLGGLLQSASYLSGLSGGSWLIGSIYHNGFARVVDLRDSPDVWDLDLSRYKAPLPVCSSLEWLFNETDGKHCAYIPPPFGEYDHGNVTTCPEIPMFSFMPILSYDYFFHYVNLHWEVTAKAKEGFPVSIVDYWGRSLALKLINSTRGGINVSWADISMYDYWNDDGCVVPFPIVMADEQKLNREDAWRTQENSNPVAIVTPMEFTPFEMGSWYPTLNAFVDIRFIGTCIHGGRVCELKKRKFNYLTDSEILTKDYCINGMDNAGFILGTSSSVFNDAFFLFEGVIDLNSFYIPGKKGTSCLAIIIDGRPYIFQIPLLNSFEKFKPLVRDRAIYSPNPFFQYNRNRENWAITTSPELYLVDGGEDGQNIPLDPLLQPVREMDVIFAFDFSADVDNWPNGQSLKSSFDKLNQDVIFPLIPDFPEDKPLTEPIFLGCDLETDYYYQEDIATPPPPPLIVYIPHKDFVYQSNRSTLQISYSHWEISKMIENGYSVATQGNSTNWKTCMACAVIKRSLAFDEEVPDECEECYEHYCYHALIN